MPVPQVNIDELATALAGGAPLYDVREPDEYHSVHVDGAVSIPLGEVTSSVQRFAQDCPIYVICASGARSSRAVEYLRSSGLDAHNVAGGTNAWVKAGRDAVTSESSS